jgi:hypothetical protein
MLAFGLPLKPDCPEIAESIVAHAEPFSDSGFSPIRFHSRVTRLWDFIVD